MTNETTPAALGLSDQLGPTSPELTAVADLVAVLCDPEGKAAIRGSDGDLAIIDAALTTLRFALDDCQQYLKEGETLSQRIERERRDTEAVLNLLIREKQKTERLRSTLQEIGAAAVSQPCPQLDKPTDFAISQSIGMQLAMIARAADEALGA